MDIFSLPAGELLQKRKRFRRELLEAGGLLDLRVALLGGSTTSEVTDFLELYLLAKGFRPSFYQSEYGRFYEEAIHEPEKIQAFAPDFIYIHTHYRNVQRMPSSAMSPQQVDNLLASEVARYTQIWSSLQNAVGCQIIQNNFDPSPFNSLGSLDSVVTTGQNRFLLDLNREFSRAALADSRLVINDIHLQSAQLGLDNWFDWRRWYSYKIVTTPEGSSLIARSLATLIAAMRGKSKKCLVLDLDNTLWGGVIGDDGADHIQIGNETAVSEAYTAMQKYCLSLRERGVLLAVCSKNDEQAAKLGFDHPDSVLKLEHFSCFKANWEPKSVNIEQIARELNLGLDSFVFVDDNPAERAIVRAQLPQVSVPEVGAEVALYPFILQQERYFEVASLSAEDFKRAEAYTENAARLTQQAKFSDYGEYLDSLAMSAEIDSFQPVYLERITQLINKSNQFNLTTRRYTYSEIQKVAGSAEHICIYGRLRDTFGDNGLVSVIIGTIRDQELVIDLWIMSCRVLKREMELAMLDGLATRAQAAGLKTLTGRYIRSDRNSMVKDHYSQLGFEPVEGNTEEHSEWRLHLATYQLRTRHILIEQSDLALQ